MRTFIILTAALAVTACGAADASTRESAVPTAEESEAPVGAAAVQDEPAVAGPDAATIEVTASLDGERYTATGTGECKHAPQASIYGVPSAMWLVQYFSQGAVRSVALTLWRPQSGDDDQLSLSVTTPAGTSRISTVQGGELKGSATARLDLNGAGGRLRVDGRDADGRKVTVDVHCSRFAALEAVGG